MTARAAQTPDPTFVAKPSAATGKLRSVRDIDDYSNPVFSPDGITDLIAQTTPMTDVGWGALYAYMVRRFGYAPIGGDPYKDMCGVWLLTSPDPDVFVKVSPALNGSVFNFAPLIPGEAYVRAKLPRQRLEEIATAYRTVLLDLLRPVRVHDSWINAKGEVDDDSHLLEEDENEVQPFIADYTPHSTRGIPAALIAGDGWWPFLAMLRHLGQGDVATGRDALASLGRRAMFENFRIESIDVRLLASIGIGEDWLGLFFDAERDVYLDGQLHPELAERRQRLKDEIAGAVTDAVPAIDHAMIERAIPIVRALAPGSHLPQQLELLQDRRRLEREWREMVAIGGGEFPDACLDIQLNEAGLKSLPDRLAREGASGLSDWAKRVLADPDGVGIMCQIMVHLKNQVKQDAESRSPRP